MPILKITVKSSVSCNGKLIEKGMNVEYVKSGSGTLTTEDVKAVRKAFEQKYSIPANYFPGNWDVTKIN
jgi:hypothetical protein